MIEYAEPSPEVRAVFDDIMRTRHTDWVSNFWKVLAHDPPTLRRIWSNVKEVMAPGALDALTKEMMYVAISASNTRISGVTSCAGCVTRARPAR